jgi:DNA gyrase/topoisomerase IV subunit B
MNVCQTNMTSRKQAFGSDPVLSEAFLKKVLRSGLVENVLQWAQFKQDKELKKNDGKKKSGKLTGIPKLEDANEAGGKNAQHCTLILTEGDSAKALVRTHTYAHRLACGQTCIRMHPDANAKCEQKTTNFSSRRCDRCLS